MEISTLITSLPWLSRLLKSKRSTLALARYKQLCAIFLQRWDRFIEAFAPCKSRAIITDNVNDEKIIASIHQFVDACSAVMAFFPRH